jgi:MFS family permease
MTDRTGGNSVHSDNQSEGAPTRARIGVLGALCALSGVLYLDRICISAALDSILSDLRLTNTQGGYVLMAFTLAYGLFEVPTGRWGDRIGGRRVLTRIALWWSAFTALTGACVGFWSLVVVRFLFGAGEAGAFPNVARVLSHWFPPQERGRAQGVLLAASLTGGAVAPFLAAVLIQRIGWRWTFVVFGGVGAAWSAGFWWWFRDDPATHPSVGPAELAHIGRRPESSGVHSQVPWAAVARSRSVYTLALIIALASFNSYIYFSWYPKYLKDGRHVEPTEAGVMASTVLALAAAGVLVGGVLVDRMTPRGGRHAGWHLLGGGGFLAASALLLGALRADDPWVSVAFTALSCLAAQSTQPLWWTAAIGISGRHVGAIFGLMNAVGVFGAMCSQYLVGAMADRMGALGYSGRAQWDPIFSIDAGVLLCAALAWATFQFAPVEPSERSSEPQHGGTTGSG